MPIFQSSNMSPSIFEPSLMSSGIFAAGVSASPSGEASLLADFIGREYRTGEDSSVSTSSDLITHSATTLSTMTDGYGPELVVNGGFDSDSDWTKGDGWSISGGKARSDGSQTAVSNLDQSLSQISAGKVYEVTHRISDRSAGGLQVLVGGSALGYNYADGFYRQYVSTTTTGGIFLQATSNFVGSVDSVSVREMPVIKWAPHNLLTYSEELDNAAWTKNSFNIVANDTTAPDSTETADKITTTGASGGVQNTTALSASVSHTIVCYAKYIDNPWIRISRESSAVNAAWFNIQTGVAGTVTDAADSSSITDVGNGWYRLELVMAAPTSSSQINFVSLSSADNSTSMASGKSAHVWGMHLYRSDLGGMADNPDQPLSRASYVPTTSSAKYLSRVGHHVFNGSAWTNEGLLAESEARTNLETYSDILDAQWSKSGSTITEDSAVSPAGLEDASLVKETATTGNHRITGNFVPIVSTTYTFSVYAKKKERTIFSIGGAGLYASNEFPEFDVDNGIAYNGGTGNADVNIQDVGNGWFRCSVTFTATGASAYIMQLHDSLVNSTPPSSTGKSYTGDGTSGMYFWGAQVEATSSPFSSLIPTSGSSVTRAAESFTIPSANLPWPEPVYTGSELVTNGTFDTDSDWTKGSNATISGGKLNYGSGTSGDTYQNAGLTSGPVYAISFEISNYVSGTVKLRGGLTSVGTSRSGNGSFVEYLKLDGTNANLIIDASSNFEGSIDNVSVREINPLSVSIAMDGRMTYANTWTSGTRQEAKPWRWQEDSNNLLHITIDSTDAGDGRLTGTQIASGTVDYATFGDAVAPDILSSINFATRSGSTFFQVASSGVSGTANTAPTELADLSSADLNLAYDYMGTVGTFRIWDRDIGDAGLVEVTAPSYEPSLSLDFTASEDSFVVMDWSE